jgi:hypothetical protein
LDPYFRRLLSSAGGAIQDLETEVLRRALTSGTLLVTGVKLWSALFQEAWRHREASVTAFHDYLKAPMKPKYLGKT